MKRFYKKVAVNEKNGDFTVGLDGKEIRTPEKGICIMPTRIMADAVAKEWDGQLEEINPAAMPITKLVNTAIDRVGIRREALIDELIGFAGSDQVCYRADHPEELVLLQKEIWDPLLQNLKTNHDIDLKTTTGIMFQEQDPKQIKKIRVIIEAIESFELTAFYGMVTVTGSVTIGLNLFEDKISLDEAWNAGHLDENFQTSKWGSDEEAEERRRNLRNELDSAHYFLKLCRNNVG